jgi:hypothetical protein
MRPVKLREAGAGRRRSETEKGKRRPPEVRDAGAQAELQRGKRTRAAAKVRDKGRRNRSRTVAPELEQDGCTWVAAACLS